MSSHTRSRATVSHEIRNPLGTIRNALFSIKDSLSRDKEKLIQTAEAHQDRLKEIGDWKIFPQTIEMIARGRFALDESDNVYVDGNPVPQGYRETFEK